MNDTDKISSIIDISFYSREVGISFSSVLDAAQHFNNYGQMVGASPSPFILWGWIKSTNSRIKLFRHFLQDPIQTCFHPAIKEDVYFSICKEKDGNIYDIIGEICNINPYNIVVVRDIAEAGVKRGLRDVRNLFGSISSLYLSDFLLEINNFSSTWYLEAYEDVRYSDINPFRHYVVSGWLEGRDPSPQFSTAGYLIDHPDVRESGQNPLIHFLQSGEREGRIRRPSTAHFPSIRHQTKTGSLPAQYVPFNDYDDVIIRQLCNELNGAKVIIVVPFYKNEYLVELVCGSLVECVDELTNLEAAVVLVNDSPEYVELADELQTWAHKLSEGGIDTAIFESKANKGFIYSCNIGLKCAEMLRCYCLLLNSDTKVQVGSLSEMISVAEIDDRFAFINPMSNNATIATLGLEPTGDLDAAAKRHAEVSGSLPRYMIVPTCVGFCLLIKPEIILLFGYLDEAYGKGYNEENDYIMRANRKGYISIIASQAFVAHIGEQSFTSLPDGREGREMRNQILLQERYPEYRPAVDEYFSSSEANARRIVERYAESNDVLIDASSLSLNVNGTSVLSYELIPKIINKIGVDRCTIKISEENLKALDLESIDGLNRIDTSVYRYSKVAIRLSQPYHKDEVISLSQYAAKTVFLMLDSISDDCLYLRNNDVHILWEWVAEHADAIIYNSEYTLNKFQNRFRINPKAIQLSSYHSLHLKEYNVNFGNKEKSENSNVKPYILIVGNYYQHKAVEMSLVFTDNVSMQRIMIGSKIERKNLISFESGSLTKAEVSALYQNSRVVLFPSLYEGFGFPLLEGLAHEKPIVIHDNKLNRDIVSKVGSMQNVVFFDRFSQIESAIHKAISLKYLGKMNLDSSKNGWNRSADEIRNVLMELCKEKPKFDKIVYREKSIKQL